MSQSDNRQGIRLQILEEVAKFLLGQSVYLLTYKGCKLQVSSGYDTILILWTAILYLQISELLTLCIYIYILSLLTDSRS